MSASVSYFLLQTVWSMSCVWLSTVHRTQSLGETLWVKVTEVTTLLMTIFVTKKLLESYYQPKRTQPTDLNPCIPCCFQMSWAMVLKV